ncbi:MAG: RidA family protein [Solobacterium sp.]|nr:RidA family protein [Solobacterium sp.]
MTDIQYIKQIKQLKANGCYTPAVKHNGVIYLSGQFAVDPETGSRIHSSAEEEARRILENIKLILAEAGSDLKHVLRCTVYIKSINDWDSINAVYEEYFSDNPPARTVVTVKELHFGFNTEIDLIAAETV